MKAPQWWLIACIIYYKNVYVYIIYRRRDGPWSWSTLAAALRQVGDISLSFTPFYVSKYLTRTRYSVPVYLSTILLEVVHSRTYRRTRKKLYRKRKRKTTFSSSSSSSSWPLLILTPFPSSLRASAA